MMNAEPAIRITELNNALSNDNRRYPYEKFAEGGRPEFFSITQLMPSIRLSPKSCSASERMARLFVMKPPIISAIAKNRFRKKASAMSRELSVGS